MGPAVEPEKVTENANAVNNSAMNHNLQPIKDAVETLISRVNDGDASPRDIVAELSRVARLINDVNNGHSPIVV